MFKSEESKLLIIQIRSSVTKTGKAPFVDDVLEWATQAHLDKIIVLSRYPHWKYLNKRNVFWGIFGCMWLLEAPFKGNNRETRTLSGVAR